MSIWSSIATDPSAWIDPQTLARMDASNANTRDSDAGIARSALEQWGMPGMTAGASSDAELAQIGFGYAPGADPQFDRWLQSNPYAIGMADVQTPAQYAAARSAYLYGDPNQSQAVIAQHLQDRGLTKTARRLPGNNAAEVGYFDRQGDQVGATLDRSMRDEGTNAELLAMIAMAAPALYGVATAGAAGAAGSGASGGLAGVDLGALPATSAGAAEGAAAAPAAFIPGVDSAASGYMFNAVAPSAVDLGSLGGTMATGAGAAAGGNALSNLVTPGNLLQAGASLGGALIGSSSADRALQAQQQATNAALTEQRRQYDQTRTDLYGARDFARADLQQGNQQSRMDLLSGRDWARNDLQQGQQQARADLNQGLAGSRVDLNQGLKGALADYAPYQQAGQQALSQYQQQIAKPATAADVMQDPGYAFGLDQGQQALDRKIAAMGGRVSGAALKAATRYGTDYASTGYNAAYQRRQDSLNRLASLAGMGQQTAGQTANARLGTADRLSSAGLSTGQGLATGALGTAGTMAQTGYNTGQSLSSGALNTAGQLAQGQFTAAGGAANAGMNRANAISDLYSGQGNAAGGAMLAQGNIWANAGNQLAALYGRRQQNP